MQPSLLGIALLLALVSCSKPDAGATGSAPSATTSGSEVASGSASASASATPTPTPTPTPTSTSTPTSSGSVKPTASGAACGDKPLPDCPLKKWMKDNTAPAMAADDYDALASAFDKIATFAPPGYPNWASISKDGAAAARAASKDGVKAGCRACHEQYKKKYKDEMRARPLP